MGNLTLAVIEIQKLLVESNGVTIEHPIKLAETPEGEQVADENAVQGGNDGGDGGGDPPTVMLRGAEQGQEGAVAGSPDGGGNGEGDGGGDGGDGDRRRLSSLGTRDDRSTERPARGKTAALRLRGHHEGGQRDEGEGVRRTAAP